MKPNLIPDAHEFPLLYYKTKEEIDTYRKKPVKQKLQWLQAQMEFFYKAMPAKAKRIRDKLNSGNSLKIKKPEMQ